MDDDMTSAVACNYGRRAAFNAEVYTLLMSNKPVSAPPLTRGWVGRRVEKRLAALATYCIRCHASHRSLMHCSDGQALNTRCQRPSFSTYSECW